MYGVVDGHWCTSVKMIVKAWSMTMNHSLMMHYGWRIASFVLCLSGHSYNRFFHIITISLIQNRDITQVLQYEGSSYLAIVSFAHVIWHLLHWLGAVFDVDQKLGSKWSLCGLRDKRKNASQSLDQSYFIMQWLL